MSQTPTTDVSLELRRTLEAAKDALIRARARHASVLAEEQKEARRVAAQDDLVTSLERLLRLADEDVDTGQVSQAADASAPLVLDGDGPPTEIPADAVSASAPSRVQLVHRVLLLAEQPVSARDIQISLQGEGHLDVRRPNHAVHKALADLVKAGKVARTGPGLYALSGDTASNLADGGNPKDGPSAGSDRQPAVRERSSSSASYLSGPAAIRRTLSAAERPLSRQAVLQTVIALQLLDPALKNASKAIAVGLDRLEARGEVHRTSDGFYEGSATIERPSAI